MTEPRYALHAATPLQKQRADLGLSLRELERRSGVSRGLISLYERGRYVPSTEQLAAIMGALQAARMEQAFDGAQA